MDRRARAQWAGQNQGYPEQGVYTTSLKTKHTASLTAQCGNATAREGAIIKAGNILAPSIANREFSSRTHISFSSFSMLIASGLFVAIERLDEG